MQDYSLPPTPVFESLLPAGTPQTLLSVNTDIATLPKIT